MDVPPPELPKPAAPTPAETEIAKNVESETPLAENAATGIPGRIGSA